MPQIVVLGAGGEAGQRLARRFAGRGFELRLAGHASPVLAALARELAAETSSGDRRDAAWLKSIVGGARLLVHCAGPFQEQDASVAQACLEAGTHYLDLSDARAHFQALRALDASAKERGVCLLAGAGALPALSSAIVAALEGDFATVNEIWVAFSPGANTPMGPARFAGILYELGQPVRMKLGGEWSERKGWGDERWAELPAPIGPRRVYNAGAPELDLLCEGRRASTVRVSLGLPAPFVARRLAWLRPSGSVSSAHGRRAARWCRGLAFLGGRPTGALGVWMRGANNQRLPMERRMCLSGGDAGMELQLAPAMLLAERLIAAAPIAAGARAAASELQLAELLELLAASGVRTVRGDLGGWHPND